MDQPSWINRTLSKRYVIEALLGQGGMSAVYKATDPNLKRVVAIKMIHPHLADDSKFISRFEEEAAAVAKLRHPNIVQVFDFNTDEGVYYMVLEFIPGETLQDRLRRLNKAGRQLSIEEAIKFTINICDAMNYAHKQGMIHRDIKPANIMLDIHGQAILMDFGIVKIVGAASHTATGAVVGTARYLSPELIRSEVPTPRSDIYSLGITLYEMLSGEPPFNADSAMSLMMMHLNDPVPDLSSIRPDVPAALENILQKSLEKDPTRRYSSAAEMSADLKRVLAELERQKSASEPTVKDIPVPTAHQAETQVETPVPEETIVEQMPQDETLAEPVQTGFDSTQVEENPPEERMEPPKPAPVRPEPTPVQEGAVQSHDGPPQNKSRTPLALGLGAGGVILVLIILGIFGLRSLLSPGAAQLPTETPTEEPILATATELPTLVPTATSTPTEIPTPTNTLPPLYVRINNITINNSYQYVVEYETFGYTEALPGMHVHFFFDTVPPDQAGVPGSGPWILYGGPRPFTGYETGDKPASAIQMCALVANADHSVIQESGNCFDLPDS
jgi:serine/threonine-protein kinase